MSFYILVSRFFRETNLNWYLNLFSPQRLSCSCCLPFAALWSSISWLGELQLWYLLGQQITALLKALWEWPIVHLWEKARSLEGKKEFLCDCLHSLKLRAYSYLLVFRAVFASDENEIVNSKGYFCCRDVEICISVGLFAFFLAFFFSRIIINGNPTFSAPVTPVIRTCWQLKVKFIVTQGSRLRCHIKNGPCIQSRPWKQTQGMRRDQRAAPASFSSLQRCCSDGGMCVPASVWCYRE